MRTIVIGEVGNNHESEDDIIGSINFLRSRGCLIKFQAHQGEFEHLKDYVIPKEMMKRIAADDIFYSVFNTEMVDWLEENVNPLRYKIASRSFDDANLYDRVIKTGKRLIVSIPFPREQRENKQIYYNNIHALIMHCVASYPSLCAHLECVGETIGFSDHTTSTLVPALAVAKGARIIEKHFTIREMSTPDRPHSLLPAQWDKMLANIKEAEYHCGL